MSITTRRGDDGTTALLYGQRVPKDHPRMAAVGALDELNAALGLARAALPPSAEGRKGDIAGVQKSLVAMMGEVVCAEEDGARHAGSSFQKLGEADVGRLDALIAGLEAGRHGAFDWATPGANPASAALDFARTVARRAERQLVSLGGAGGHGLRPLLLAYANRLSDLLWLLAREAAE
ncbi:MAG: cob(I)yrinic acid a,c-diamide adenosyltransferase [Opitutaceae bacterium]|jgi:cob(I)alamin adenosyltransferase|nr:cob(I)yrinic acid a,c-diamide adenosyltransferase [Opitutaceae bacterium]